MVPMLMIRMNLDFIQFKITVSSTCVFIVNTSAPDFLISPYLKDI